MGGQNPLVGVVAQVDEMSLLQRLHLLPLVARRGLLVVSLQSRRRWRRAPPGKPKSSTPPGSWTAVELAIRVGTGPLHAQEEGHLRNDRRLSRTIHEETKRGAPPSPSVTKVEWLELTRIQLLNQIIL
jgi:hypothetical protein